MHARSATTRDLLEQRLRREVPDKLWDYLVAKRYISEYEHKEDPLTLDDLVREAELLQELSAADTSRPARPVSGNLVRESKTEAHLSAEMSTYQEALSEVVASVADLDVDVVAFREKFLAAQIMHWDQVEPWVKTQEAAQGAPTQWITSVLPTDYRGKSVTYDDLLLTSGVEARMLKYARPGEKWQAQVATAAGGPLERLRRLSEGLSKAHGWTEAQATVFVLTGLTPTVSLIRTTEGGHNVRHGTWCAWAERIVLTVNPAVPVEEVAAAYRAARQRYGKRRTSGSYRVRTQSLKHLRLAGFVARRRPAMRWNDLVQSWNQCEPQEQYTQGSNFRRDAALAQERLLYRGLVRPK